MAPGRRGLGLRRSGAPARHGGARAGCPRLGLTLGRRRREARFLLRAALVFALALGIRLVYLSQITGTPLTAVLLIDSATYDMFARMILRGTFGGENIYAVNVLYPWLVAATYAVSKGSLLFTLQVQAVLDALTCVLAAWVARRHFGAPAGVVAGVLLALCGPLVFYSGALLTPTLVTFLGTCALAALTLWQGNGRGRWAAVAGLLVGLATLARGNNALLVPLSLPGFLLLARDGRGPALKAWATFAACAFAPALLATLRNFAVAGHPVPVAANYAAFWIGHNPLANGLYVLPPWAKSGEYAHEVWGLNAAIARQVGHPMTLAETARWLLDQGIAWAIAHPGAELRLLVTKFRYFWNAIEPPTNLSYHFARAWSPLLAFLPVGFGVLGPTGLVGAWWGAARERAFLYAWILAGLLTALLFYVSAEYRLPVVPAVAVLASYAVVEIVLAASGRAKSRRLVEAAVALPLLGLAFFARPVPLATQALLHADYTNFGTLYARRGDYVNAKGMYERATALAPNYGPAWQGLASVFERTGDAPGALRAAQRARAAGADVPMAPASSALADSGLAAAARFQAGDYAGALEAFEHLEREARAAGDTSLASGLLNNVGLCRLRLGDLAGATRAFEQVIAERPRAVKSHYNLGRVLAAQGKRDEAIAAYQRALAIDPAAPGVREALQALQR